MGLKEKIKDMISKFECQRCGKKVSNNDVAKYNIYIEKWFETQAKSATEIKLCAECAEPIVKVIREARAMQAMRKKDCDVDPNGDRPYSF